MQSPQPPKLTGNKVLSKVNLPVSLSSSLPLPSCIHTRGVATLTGRSQIFLGAQVLVFEKSNVHKSLHSYL